jgi:transketolase
MLYYGRMTDLTLKHIRKSIIELCSKSKEGHIPSAFSILDILWVLYDRVMKYDSLRPRLESRDRFILSKGHASLGLYAILNIKGFISNKEFQSFGQFESILGGHPDRNKIPGVEASTGSLGHGMPMAVGMALALKAKKSTSRTFVLIGDGEANEGSIWESALLAAHHQLSNLTCILDYNHSTDRALRIGNVANKFEAFGWRVSEIDGHDHAAIEKCLTSCDNNNPHMVVANTIKGYGCKAMENNPAWHHKAPSEQECRELLGELR